MSLRDQLLKAGLVNKKQAKQAESQAKLKEHHAKKNKVVAEQVERETEEEQRILEEQREEKRRSDYELNMMREQRRQAWEDQLRCSQLMKSNAVNESKAQNTYYFLETERFVRKVMVTTWQREMLARGKLAIGRLDENVDEFLILPYHVAQVVLQLHPAMIVTLHPEVSDEAEIRTDDF
ncbi:MAG: hypothetical protein RIR26_1848 [Pseudomonadota bacterium]